MKRKTDNFNKFYNKKNNAAIKESFRQEKKAVKKERREAIERRFEERRHSQSHQGSQDIPTHKGRFAKGAAANGPFDKKAAPGAKAGAAQAHSGTPANAALTGEQLPLNKYIAHGGICSRRDAAELIKQGKVTVNGKSVTEPGTKVLPTDLVKVNGKKVTISRNFVYVLLNKPKDYLTTMDDPQGRRTVLDLIRSATTERVFPVGRLDRNTSGVLLLTNDGDLAQKLAHPSHEIKKVYHVTLDKALTKADFDKIVGGVTLEDGPAFVDVLAYADPKDRAQVGLEIHSGRNRIVRRIFEYLGYDVRGLDRVMYAGLTKKNVQRGKWRLLTEREIRILKYLNSSIKGSSARAKDWAAPHTAPHTAPQAAPTPEAPVTTSRPTKPAAPKAAVRKPAPAPTRRPAKASSASHPAKPSSAGRPAKPFGAARPGARKPAPSGRPARPFGAGRPTAARPTPRPRKPKTRDDEE
jgi:23S rRNA pseudouridine2605 synthase